MTKEEEWERYVIQRVHEAKAGLLKRLIETAMGTDGAEVWRHLFAEMLHSVSQEYNNASR